MIIFICWSDEDLAKINLRESDILEKVYLKYKKKVYNFLVIKTGGNKDVAEDIFSQTFHAAIESAPKLKSTKNLLSWLLKIANRRFMDHLRAHYRQEKYLPKMYDDEAQSNEPSESVNTKEETLLFNMVFERLPDAYKKVLTLKYVEEKSQKEIAEIISKSEKAVESLLSRSKQLLKKELGEYKGYFND